MNFQLDFRRAPVTLVLAAAIVALELLVTGDELLHGDHAARRLFLEHEVLGMQLSLWKGEYWRPLTSTLLHGDLLHAGFNLFWLVRFGNHLERRFGSFAFLLGTVALAYTASVADFVLGNADYLGYGDAYRWLDPWLPEQQHLHQAVGFSGVIYGYFGLLLVGRRTDPAINTVCDERIVRLLLVWLFCCVYLTSIGVLRVANVAHFTGFSFGWLYGQAIYNSRHSIIYRVAALLLTVGVLSLLAFKPPMWPFWIEMGTV